jgi:hypothetical protein
MVCDFYVTGRKFLCNIDAWLLCCFVALLLCCFVALLLSVCVCE